MTVDLEKLTKPFPKEAIKQRVIGGGRTADYVEGHVVIHRLNDAVDEWSLEIKRIDTVNLMGKDRDGRDRPYQQVTAHVALTIPGMGTREHIGVQDVQQGSPDLVKGAVTDALKKAATLFGVGLELYGPDYEAGEVASVSQPSRPQPRDTAPADALPRGIDMIAPGQLDGLKRMANDLEMVLDDRVAADYNVGSATMLTREQAGDLIVKMGKEWHEHKVAKELATT